MDKIIKCRDCDQEFAFTAGEQEFFAAKKLNQPSRCLICRAIFRAAKDDRFRGSVKGKGSARVPD
ncbi:zinc-ribbon domain-containing protein [Patescibacteria group bacterium]|nr:zinc-ribbon domain-containing protein [Patescibacteria group bacterium]